jgi:dihydroorotase
VLAEVFEKAGKLDKLEDFVSRFGAEFYGLPLNMKTVTLRKGSWTVPAECNGIVPFKAGQELAWQVV